MIIAFPSSSPGGLDSMLSEHFGHCDVFTLVNIDQGEVGQVQVLQNQEHSHGGCLEPVMLLKNAGVDTLVAGGMGMRPLAGFQQVGIDVFYNEGATRVGDALTLVLSGRARKFGPAQTCSGGGGHGNGGGGCGGHG